MTAGDEPSRGPLQTNRMDDMTRAHLKFRLAILVVSALLFVVSAEVVLRALCTVCSWTEQNFGTYASPYEAPSDGKWYFVRPPNTVSSYMLPEFDFEVTTNSLGIRDIEHPTTKPVNEFRMIGLGDSFTEGQGASFEDSYLKVLESNLNEKLEGVNVRVISGGVSGSDPFYCYTLLKDKLVRFDPDLVTLAINASDVMDIVARGGHERFLADGTVAFAEPPVDEWLFKKSHLYRVISFMLLNYDWFGLRPSQLLAKRQESLHKLEMLIGEYQELARDEGFRFVVILHPDYYELSERRYTFDASGFRRQLDEKGVSTLDLMEYFTKRLDREGERPENLYWQKDFHHNKAGYRMLAEGVEEYLLQNDYFELESPE